jgi:hypothetical protein
MLVGQEILTNAEPFSQETQAISGRLVRVCFYFVLEGGLGVRLGLG